VTSYRDRILLLLATSLGPGLLPGGPGTWGTLPAVAAYVAVALLAPKSLVIVLLAALLLASCALSVALGPWAARYWKGKDPGHFTADELAGYFLTVVAFHAPLVAMGSESLLQNPTTVGLTALWSFIAFRVFDIVKPPPVHYLERLPEGWGILADDLGAGVYAALTLHALRAVMPGVFGL
jgi:phosphatidylglycerophosphatase A